MYNHVGLSKSQDLINWTKPEILTETDKLKNYCSPGCIIKTKDEYLLCITSYPMPEPYSVRYYADQTARLYIIRTTDFETFSEPEKIYAKGKNLSQKEEGRMIDPFIFENKDKKGEYILLFKQNGISLSRSFDMVNWKYEGSVDGGENACILIRNNKYLLIHSPDNGIGLAESNDLKVWKEIKNITLKQKEWDWASGRLTAGFAMESKGNTKYKYILFFHGSRKESFPETHGNATLAMVFTDDFETFYETP
jgi:sucrose-6-phosphate hydrolase SacC (GH32 family)